MFKMSKILGSDYIYVNKYEKSVRWTFLFNVLIAAAYEFILHFST